MTYFDGKKHVVMFTGCKTSIDALKCYWTNAFIFQGADKKNIHISPFRAWGNVKLNGNIGKTVQSRDYQFISKAMDNLKLTENVV
jgi:hypothetical protein